MAVEVINTRYEVLETFRSSDSSPYVQHKARDVQEGRVVALKIVPSELASGHPDLLPNLRAAVRAASALDHPMVSRVYDGGTLDNGDVYLVNDYVRGITLRERIRRIAPFSLAVATDIAVAIAEALTAAHRAGIIHGRLLPESVVLSPEGQIRVGEFAAGRLLYDIAPNAEEMSSPYRPPEAAFDDEPAPTDDIYALGAILYEMLTGVQAAESHGDLPTSPRSLNPGIPPALEGITLKALYPDTTVRYEEAAALLADLQAARAALRAGRALTWSPLATVKTDKPAGAPQGRRIPRPPAAKVEPEYEEDVDDRGGREAPGVLTIALAVTSVIAVVGAVLLIWFFIKFASPPPDITVPNLIGRTMDDARMLGNEKHFIPEQVGQNFSTKWPEGQIYAQDPPAGRSIKSGKKVDVYVSEGPQFLTVPDVVGMNSDAAEKAIRESTLPVGTIDDDYSETVPKGIIIKQTPAPHSNASRYTAVNFTVSKGKQPPDTPANVAANPIAPDKIEVTWQAAARATSYQVTRVADGNLTVVGPNVKDTKFDDTGLTPNMEYSYIVTAVNAVGTSAPSDQSTPAFTPPAGTDNNSGDSTSVTETTPSPTNPTSANPGPAPTPTGPSTGIAPPPPTPPSTGAVAPDTGNNQQRQFRITFRLPRRPRGDHRVRFEVTDSTGTSLVYDEMHHAGDFISVMETGFGPKVTFRIYVDDALMKQQSL